MKLKGKIYILIFLLLPVFCSGQETDSLKAGINYTGDNNTGYNFIDSYPQNASVYLNDDYIGSTPLFFVWKDSSLPKTLKVALKGFTEQNEVITEIQILRKKFNLVPEGSNTFSNTVKEDKQIYFHSPRKLLPIAVSSLISAVSGFGAYHFKSLAYDNRKNYDITGDAGELDKKKHNELLGNISLAVLQAGLGALIYFLVIE